MHYKRSKIFLLCGLLSLVLPLAPAQAMSRIANLSEGEPPEESPLWELGIGGGGTYTPHYPGSDQSQLWGIPFPFGIYRGDILHSDRRGGSRARLVRAIGYEINVSAGGGLPSSSQSNSARQGMPDLEWLGEFGPRLTIDLETGYKGELIRLGLPIRAAFSSDGRRLTDRGFLFAPELLIDRPKMFSSAINAYALLTVNFADRRFANYFYGVPPEYATAERRAHIAQAGYFLTDLNVGIVSPVLPNLRLSVSTSVQYLHGSVNQNSPLFRTPLTWGAGMILIWVFAESKDTVIPED